jgi:hypothetical protein
MQHIHPAPELPACAYWIERRLLAYLNDKRSLASLVPSGAASARRVIRFSRIQDLVIEGPLVLKAATRWSSGSGGGVVIVRRPKDLVLAAERLAGAPFVVVEPFLPFQRTMCLTFAGNAEGIEYLGAPEQIVDEEGVYQGSWFDDTRIPDEAVQVGRAIMTQAVASGYRGIAGFDCGTVEDGSTIFFDLNFRLCGSTAGLLWFEAGARRAGAPVGRTANLVCQGGMERLAEVLQRPIDEAWFLPLGFYDGAAGPDPETPTLARGLVFGRSRAEVENRYAQIRAALG